MPNCLRRSKNFSYFTQQILSFLIMLCFAVTGCASYDPLSFPTLTPDETPYHRTVDAPKLKVGVRPLLTETDQQDYFEKNLRENDVLPILVSVDSSENRSYTLRLEDIELMEASGQVVPKVPFDVLYKEHFKKTVWSRVVGGLFGGAVIAAGTFLILAPAIIVLPIMSGLNTKDVNRKIERDLREKTLAQQMIAHPNSITQALVFFRYDEKRKDVNGLTLRMRNFHSLNRNDPSAQFKFEFA